MSKDFQNLSKELYAFIKLKEYKGYDPFDGLNQNLIPQCLTDNKFIKILIVQFFKKFPINLRKNFLVQEGNNPKGLALALSTAVRMKDSDECLKIIRKLKLIKSNFSENFSIGYNFDWQNRVFYLPKGMPTVVNTSFAGHAFLDHYFYSGNEESLHLANSAAKFILQDLNILETKRGICFSYSPVDQSQVHNANLLCCWILKPDIHA